MAIFPLQTLTDNWEFSPHSAAVRLPACNRPFRIYTARVERCVTKLTDDLVASYAQHGGINHLTWVTSLRLDGNDAYPLLWEAYKRKGHAGQPISFRFLEMYGQYPSPADRHVAEFFPYFHTPEASGGKSFGLELAAEQAARDLSRRERFWPQLMDEIEGAAPLPRRRPGEGDRAMELAADAAVSAGYGSAGERCMAISVVVAVGNAADRLVPLMKERIAKLKVGDGLEPASEMGPLINKAHRDKVAGYVDKGVAEGATLVSDGRTLAVAGRPNGFFLGPCLFDNVTPNMTVYKDEIFGPVLSTTRVATYDEALELVNGNPYANGVAIFTNDGGAARKFQHDVEVGMVGINVPIPVPMAYYSFGGWKASLFGDHHIYGRDGVHFYTRMKAVTSRWPDPRHRGVDLGFPQNK